jgi:hypothetical protein
MKSLMPREPEDVVEQRRHFLHGRDDQEHLRASGRKEGPQRDLSRLAQISFLEKCTGLSCEPSTPSSVNCTCVSCHLPASIRIRRRRHMSCFWWCLSCEKRVLLLCHTKCWDGEDGKMRTRTLARTRPVIARRRPVRSASCPSKPQMGMA